MQGRAVYPPLLLSCIFGRAFRLSGMPRFAAIHRRSASVDVHSGGFLPFDSPVHSEGFLPFVPRFYKRFSTSFLSLTSPARQGSPALPVFLLFFFLGIFSPPFCYPASVNCPRWKGDPGRFAPSSSIFGGIRQDGAEGWQEGREVSLGLFRGGAPVGVVGLGVVGGSRVTVLWTSPVLSIGSSNGVAS